MPRILPRSLCLSLTLASLAVASMTKFPSPGWDLVLAPETIDSIQQPVPPAPEWGMAYILKRWGDEKVVGHTGGYHGWISGLWRVPRTGDALIILTNGTDADQFLDRLESAWVTRLARSRK